jgi:hypothetical protein
VLQGPGENAGVIDVGDGLAIAFKVESHNHPSAVEPYQGAATGVGGILRDILRWEPHRAGRLAEARPARRSARASCSRDRARNRRLRQLVGVPNVAGETVFDAAYGTTRSSMRSARGRARTRSCARAPRAPATSSCLRATGRDGIGGASVLPRRISTPARRTSARASGGRPVHGQEADECTLELAAGRLVAPCITGRRDSRRRRPRWQRAAAQASSSTSTARCASRMQPFEIKVSESQERMAASSSPPAWPSRGGAPAAAPSTVWAGHRRRLAGPADAARWSALPAEALADAPRYPLRGERPDALAERPLTAEQVPAITDPGALLLALLAAPNICAKTWVYEQYDQVVGSGTVARPGGDAGVVRLTPSERGIAVALDGDGARVALDPRRGGAEAVAQSVLNVACSGAEPAAVTNCLNFGNPERPGSAYALREAITGMAEASQGARHAGRVGQRSRSTTRRRTTDPPDAGGGLRRCAGAGRCGRPRRARGCERLPLRARDFHPRARRLGVAGTRERRCGGPYPRGRPSRAALALRPPRRARPRSRAVLRTRRLGRRARHRAGGACARIGQRARGLDRAGRGLRGNALRRVLRSRRRDLRDDDEPRLAQACDAAEVPLRGRSAPWAARASRARAASSARPAAGDSARGLQSALPRAMEAG